MALLEERYAVFTVRDDGTLDREVEDCVVLHPHDTGVTCALLALAKATDDPDVATELRNLVVKWAPEPEL